MIGASSRRPSTGNAASAWRWPRGGQKRSAWRSAKRASAQAAPAVSAIAARQVRSWRARRSVRSASSARSPASPWPKRWAQPVTSSSRPASPPKPPVLQASDAFLGDGAAQRIDRHPGRVAVAPVGQGLDQAMVGLRLARRRDQVGHQRARIGEPHVRAQAGGAGMRVDRDQARTAFQPDDGSSSPSRPISIRGRGRRSRESIRGKLGEPQRDNAFHRSTPGARLVFR